MSFLRKMFSGKVKTDDPRRYLVEAMLAAMEADGEVTGEEMQVLSNNVEHHELFQGLTKDETSRMVDLAADAIRDAGGGRKRVADIAKGLPSRSYRLTAYAMACEVCVSDQDIAEAEIELLDALQSALQLDESDAHELFEAARNDAGLLTLEEKTGKMRELMPRFVDCMALMASADGEVHVEERFGIRAVLRSIPDMTVLTSDELDEAIDVSFDRVKGKEPNQEIRAFADTITNPSDRYWTMVYMMIICLADGTSDWREIAFLKSAESAFGLTDTQMDAAMETARMFPAVQLGGDAPS
jgi:uncharacterized tellurite resistance protein B-like protein